MPRLEIKYFLLFRYNFVVSYSHRDQTKSSSTLKTEILPKVECEIVALGQIKDNFNSSI